ncbi:hypothetical protein WME90_29890 [Sorangium sp. So ce375]|uniref:hypothetical protein n=1 Tax=Sorangium sp. So ce375 TaxID=3133306 RepID=UPI003F5C315E
MRILAALLATFVLAACTTAATPPVTAPQPSASAPATSPVPAAEPPASAPVPAAPEPVTQTPACAGRVDSPPAGAEPVNEPAPSFAIQPAGKGALCDGRVFTVKQPFTVYRVFTARYENTEKAGPTGAYWTFQRPGGALEAYRSAYNICVEWNDLDALNECQVDVGARIVLGPGQSAECPGGTKYAASAANQVLIIRGQDGKVPVSACKQSTIAWGK